MTMLGSGVVVGQSAASAVVGLIADGAGAGAALVAPVAAAGVVLAAGVWNLLATRRRARAHR